MSLLSSVVHETVKFGKSFRPNYQKYGYVVQEKALRKLLEKARTTAFGNHYQFARILRSEYMIRAFKDSVPTFNYNSIYNQWWYRTLQGEENICWPGKVKHFALTSGTSESSSKRVPITSDMLKSIMRTGMNQFLNVSEYSLPKSFYDKSILMLGGSTNLEKVNNHFEGDLSGILAGRLPVWINHFYKPGKKIASEKEWEIRLKLITEMAKDWDVGIIAGVPAWIQILLERIIEHYKVKHIHEIWPNLKFFVHGGVCFNPYRKGFENCLGEEIYYQETYLASEGFLAFQNRPEAKGMQLVLNNGTFFEFIPFNEDNFTSGGDLLDNYESLLLDEVKMNVDYAILISTNAGTWRYLIGDVVRFNSLETHEIIITGRTQHFLSFCGEHLSVDNMNNAIQIISEEFGIRIKEYTVAGIPYENLFAHKWFIGSDKGVDKKHLKQRLDEILKELNDDYRTERNHALKEVIIELLPNDYFYEWMKIKGKEGGQQKFPRVIKNQPLKDWEEFIYEKSDLCRNSF